MTKQIQEYKGVAEKFKAIGHPVRIAIFSMLCKAECNRLTVKNIYENLQLDQPSASRHLGIMRSTGILERVQEAGNTFYCICKSNPYVACIKTCFDKQIFE